MTVPRKAALSLLISTLLFGVVAVLAFTGLFNLIETRFYDAALAKSFAKETESDAKLIGDLFADLETGFARSLSEPAVRRSFLPNQNAEDIFDRTRIYGTLLESLSGLQSIRFVDHNGTRIHFSTYAPDTLNQTRTSVSYRNYNQDPQNLPFEQVQTAAAESCRLIMDSATDRIIFSYPFFDSLDVYRGTALFTLSVRAVAEKLIGENKLKIGEDVSVTSAPPGVVTGSPGTSKQEILGKVSSIWNDGILSMTSFESGTGITLALISTKAEQGFFYGRLVDEKIFSFPQPMRVIILLSVFLTIYLAIFLFFNLKQDPLLIVQNRLKNLQISLIEQYYERKAEIDWERWSRELEQRREDVRTEVKRGIKLTEEKQKDIDQLIDKSWDELLAAIGGTGLPGGGLDEEKLQSILSRVLQTLPAASRPASSGESLALSSPRNAAPLSPATLDSDFEEVSFTDDDEEQIEELEEIEAFEDVEDLDEIEDIESFDEVNLTDEVSLTDVVKDIEAEEEIGELEEVEGDGVLEELEDIAETEAVETAKAFEDAEPLEELEEAEPLEDVPVDEIAEEAPEEPVSEPPLSPEMEMDKVASHIEFDLATNTDGDDIEDILGTELEIFSPFASEAFFMPDEVPENDADLEDEDEKKNRTHRLTETIQPGTGGLLSRSRMYAGGDGSPLLEIYNDSGSPIMYAPFVFEGNTEPEMLQPGSSGLLASAGSLRDVIIERDGVNFINQDIFTPGEETEHALDIDFKELVDSVIG